MYGEAEVQVGSEGESWLRFNLTATLVSNYKAFVYEGASQALFRLRKSLFTVHFISLSTFEMIMMIALCFNFPNKPPPACSSLN